MSTKISWCDETINPVVGCSKLSAGCQNCYAESMARRLANMGLDQYKQVTMGAKGSGYTTPFGAWNGTTAFVESELYKPGNWRKPRTIFVSSMGDLFHESVRMEWIEQIVGMVAANPQHTFIFLTKRPDRMNECLGKLDHAFFSALYQLQAGTQVDAWNWPLPNLALGVSAENQQTADERIPLLLETPAAIRFASLEPMIAPIDLNRIHEVGTTAGGAHWESWELPESLCQAGYVRYGIQPRDEYLRPCYRFLAKAGRQPSGFHPNHI